ncbi:hypothetical protein NBT05_00595 [Aquimarina sp. ERC-38]|uniref:hypothetical protein n=1 Tax=Aquimarina sp. ERC-38 TaxID=2949996 RepID=UPI002247A9DB|nr:hypothetical protein [Aquimarina sp. ERC-38]UZO80994.1 hypothetical protein NBT05_00595 [Aquimarina sp. ERC-38]
MDTKENLSVYLNELNKKFTELLPQVSKEIRNYEDKASKGLLTLKPKSSPQFNAPT